MKFPKNKSVVIKKKTGEKVVLLALLLILLALFLFVLFMPFHRMVNLDAKFDNLCYAIGGIGTVLFLIMSAYQIYHLAAKSTALVITEDGIYDFVTGGKGVGFIDKGKITSIRIFGTTKKPILGIQVDNSKHLIRTSKKCVQDAVLYNLDMNMPAIVIYQKDLSCSVKEAATLIYEKINSLAPSMESAKASTKVSSETKAFPGVDKADKKSKPNKNSKAAEEARLAEEAKAAEEARLAAEAKAAEEARLAAEAKAAEEARLAAEAKAAEEARLAAEAKAAEEARLAAARLAAEAKAAEEARLAAEAKAVEEARLAAEAKAVEEARLAAEAKAVEEARLAAEAKAVEENKNVDEPDNSETIVDEPKAIKYIFPVERFIKPGPQSEEDPSPEPYFEIMKKEA